MSYWIYAYTLNEDLCLVDYKKYLETDFDEFPVLSICLKDQISKEKLELQNPKIDIETYISNKETGSVSYLWKWSNTILGFRGSNEFLQRQVQKWGFKMQKLNCQHFGPPLIIAYAPLSL